MDFEFLDFREKFKGTTSLFACLLYASVYAVIYTLWGTYHFSSCLPQVAVKKVRLGGKRSGV